MCVECTWVKRWTPVQARGDNTIFIPHNATWRLLSDRHPGNRRQLRDYPGSSASILATPTPGFHHGSATPRLNHRVTRSNALNLEEVKKAFQILDLPCGTLWSGFQPAALW
jgi:hypothetical protein